MRRTSTTLATATTTKRDDCHENDECDDEDDDRDHDARDGEADLVEGGRRDVAVPDRRERRAAPVQRVHAASSNNCVGESELVRPPRAPGAEVDRRRSI